MTESYVIGTYTYRDIRGVKTLVHLPPESLIRHEADRILPYFYGDGLMYDKLTDDEHVLIHSMSQRKMLESFIEDEVRQREQGSHGSLRSICSDDFSDDSDLDVQVPSQVEPPRRSIRIAARETDL